MDWLLLKLNNLEWWQLLKQFLQEGYVRCHEFYFSLRFPILAPNRSIDGAGRNRCSIEAKTKIIKSCWEDRSLNIGRWSIRNQIVFPKITSSRYLISFLEIEFGPDWVNIDCSLICSFNFGTKTGIHSTEKTS